MASPPPGDPHLLWRVKCLPAPTGFPGTYPLGDSCFKIRHRCEALATPPLQLSPPRHDASAWGHLLRPGPGPGCGKASVDSSFLAAYDLKYPSGDGLHCGCRTDDESCSAGRELGGPGLAAEERVRTQAV